MDQLVMAELINNAALLLVLSVIYEITNFLSAKNRRVQTIFNGLLIAVICIAIMMMPFTFQPGIIYDTRSILISVTALIFGPIPTIITVVAAALFRISLGGTGTLPGIAVIISSALIGLAWRRWLYPKSTKWRWLNIYAMSLVVHLTMLACMLLLPYPDNLTVIGKIAAPVMIIYPVASILLGLLLIRQQDLRRIQEQLKQSEEKFQLLFNQAPLGYQSLDFDGNFIDVNQQWLDTLGYSRKDVIGKWFGDFLSPNYKEAFRKRFLIFKELGQIHSEFEMRHKDGTRLFISFEGKIGYGLDGEFKQTHCILNDITEQKAAEDALRLSEEKFRRLAENISDVIWTTDLNLKTTYISPSVERLFGESVEDHLNRSMDEKFPAETLNKIQSLLSEELEKEKDPTQDNNRTRVIEIEHYRADGTIIWISMHVSFLRDKNGHLAGFQGVTRDISERVRAEKALSHSHNLMRYIIEHSRGAVAVHDRDLKYLYVSQRYLDDYNLKEKDIIGKTHYEVLPGIPQKWREVHQKALEGQILSAEEDSYVMDDGTLAWTRWECRPWYEYDGAIGGIIVYTEFITERKRVEAALQESETRLIAAQKMAHVGNWELNLDTETIWASEESLNIYGIKLISQYLPYDIIKNGALPEYRTFLDNMLSNLITKNEKYNVEFKIKKANTGEERFVHSIAILQSDDAGKPDKVVGTLQDITDRKKAEEGLLYTSYHDHLTGLYNRRFFEDKKTLLDTEDMQPLSIIVSDINGLKLINDALGHDQGDKLIIETAKILQSCCREKDILARIGGDEFSILLPKTEKWAALEILNIIQRTCSAYNQNIANETFHINIALGCGTKETVNESFEQVCKIAEDAMYQRKLLEHKSSHSAIISSIKATMFEKSNETEEHSERLVLLSKMVGNELGLSQSELDHLELYATLHDIGKVGISNETLKKAGPLDEDEWVEMKQHSMIGYRIAMSAPDLAPIAEYILSHHERWDGKGYPQGLAGFAIPLPSRILAVVDAYDAMTENRIYRKALPRAVAIEEIKKNAGVQFDPEISKIFVENVLDKINKENAAN